MAEEDATKTDDLNHQPDEEPDRHAQPVDTEQPPRLPFPVVGIGASAGGLGAVSQFLDAMPPDGGMAFVLVQHLPPEHHSMLAEILGRHTRMRVQQVDDGMKVEPNHVYVIRPGHVLTIRDGRLHLGPRLGTSRAANRPVDDFFRSLAEEQRERAICILMSGMGSNGTAGAQAVKAVGGLCIAQDPESAEFPSMPRHLIDAGYADYVLPLADMPEVLLGYARHPYVQGGREEDAEEILRREQQHLREVLAILRANTRHDFSGYKKPTILRRVQRRMGLTHMETVGDYAKLMRRTPAEATALADDLLIHVTGFFRDTEAWESLRRLVLAPLVAACEPGATVRGWVTACSSGEEAYSLAMILVEEAERIGKQLDIKIFATDLAERALDHARGGIYPGGIESDVTPERLNRFFTPSDESYRVRPELRDRVVFASQNILQDPPFSRIDVASCRNLLIYLKPEMQQRVLGLLHFGLREGGALFLGSAETVAGAEDMFEVVDKKARIFRRVGLTRNKSVEFPLPHAIGPSGRGGTRGRNIGLPTSTPRRDGTRPSVEYLTHQALLAAHTPAAVTVDRDGRILFYHGDTRPFLQQSSGEPTRELMLLCRDGLRAPLRESLSRAAAEKTRATSTDGWVYLEAGLRVGVAVTVSPAVDDDSRDEAANWFVVSFAERGEQVAPPLAGSDPDDEARRLRAELRTTIEELQTSNEELKASNEEVMSINEELQSANEELETSKEEMQSLNEELNTVNAQLRIKMDEYQAASSDLTSLLTSTDIAVLFLDSTFRIRRFTPAIRDLVDLIASDVGRPLAALARKFEDPRLEEDARTVLERLTSIEREVRASEGRHFLRRVLPYRTIDNRIDGVVVTFVDITARTQAEEALQASEEQFRRAIEEAPIPVIMQAEDGQVLQVSHTWTELTGYTLADVPTFESWLTLAYGTGADKIRGHMRELFLGDRKTLDVAFSIRTRGAKERHWSFSASAPGTLHDGRRFVVGMATDVTERADAEAAVRASEERLRLSLESATDYAILTMDANRIVTSWSPGAEAIFGYPAEEIVGVEGDVLFTPEDRAAGAATEEFEQARRNGRAADERWHLRKDGTKFFASGVLSLLGGQGHGFVKVLRDLTIRKQMEDELRAARDDLELRVGERTAELRTALQALEAEMTRRSNLAQRLATVQEDERRRIARDLHDTVGQTLTGLSLAVAGIEASGPLANSAVDQLKQVRRLADNLGRELHEVALLLRPTTLDDIGLDPAVRALAVDWSRRTGTKVEITKTADEGRFPPDVETALYRVVQEALTNIAKHAGATHVSIVLGRREEEAVVVVEDNGAGFDHEAVRNPTTGRRGGMGLDGMRERVGLLGGTVEIESEAGQGTTVITRIPLDGRA